MSKTKSITIRDDQEAWLQNAALNLSKFVQRKLDEAMKTPEASA